MKRSIYLFALLTLLVFGCSEQSSLVSPINNVNTNEPNWIGLPQAEGMQVYTQYTISKILKGKDGGDLKIKEEYTAGIFGKVKVESKIKFPKNAFEGEKLFTMSVEQNFGSTTFLPHSNFNLPAEYDLTYEGIDLTGYTLSQLNFVYLNDDGRYKPVIYDEIKLDISKGKIEIKNARLPHFSRYGFVRNSE